MRPLAMFVCAAMLILGSVAFASPASQADGWVCPEGFEGQTLRVFNWAAYVAEDTLPNFEEACGVTVEYNIFVNNEEMLTIIRQQSAAYDIVVPTGFTVQRMIDEGLLYPLDHALIPNLSNVGETFIDPAYDPGNQYSVPYQWGTMGIAYNADFVEGEVTSWYDLFEHDGPVAWINDPRGMFVVVNLLLGFDPNTTDPEEIAAAGAFMVENGGNVVALVEGNGQALLGNGDVDMLINYNGDAYQTIVNCDCDNLQYVIPEEGTLIWTDNLAIPVNAPNPELAHVFMDYILDAQVGADLSNYTGFSSPNAAAIEQGLLDEALLNNPVMNPSEEEQARMIFAEDVADAENIYADVWNEILLALAE